MRGNPKIKTVLLLSALCAMTFVSGASAQSGTGRCAIAWARVGAALSQYQNECLRNGQIVCSNDRLTYHYHRIETLRALARLACSRIADADLEEKSESMSV